MVPTLKNLLAKYGDELLENVVPFWMQHAIDADGGINTCIDDDGTVMNRDRWGWSQWRALWVFSKLFNSIEPLKEWLEIAHGIYRCMSARGPLPNGHWPLLVNEQGDVQRGYESIYTDGFAIDGLVEYWRATRDDGALALAECTFNVVQDALNRKESPPAWPYPIPPGCKPHGLSMLFSLAFFELAEATNNGDHLAEAIRHHDLVMDEFLRSESGFVLEWLNRDGSLCNEPHGAVVCPGHAIESMWFQIHIARARDDQNAIRKAIDAIHYHLEKGWDSEYGGLFLAIDAEGSPDVHWPHADMKLWWPHTESLYATLLAYEHCKQDWCLDWHQRIHDYSFNHYPLRQHGEWTQKLDRYGDLVRETLFLPVKDPFHLPRALIYCIEVLTRIVSNESALEPDVAAVPWPE
ncbi:MAG: AGE family epimerase/isomerase [Pirellulales bacterium]